MKARILVLMAMVVLLVAVDASAICFKCREQTCYMLEGTNSWCKPITNGCFAGGTCTASTCGDRCVENPEAELREPLGQEWALVKIAIRTEKVPNARLATNDAVRPAANPVQ